MRKKIVLGLAVGWTVLIAFLCLVKFSNLPSLGVKSADKYVHFTFHFGFTLIWGYYSFLRQMKIETGRIMQIVIASLFYGILIEFLQEYCTETRRADVFDVAANFTGALSAFGLYVLVKRFTHEYFSNK